MSTFLVVAHQTAATRELREALLAKKHEDRQAVFVLLTPATPVEKLLHGKGDSLTLAEKSIEAARKALEGYGIEFARAIVGDADPLKAIRDEFQKSRRTYDGIFLCTLQLGTSRWLESGLPAETEATFDVPLVHVVVSSESVAQQAKGPTITFSVRLGSAGGEIARLVAGRMGLSYYDWEVTSTAAELAGVSPATIEGSERALTLVERVLERLAVSGVYQGEESVGSLSSTTMASAIGALGSRQYREFVEEVVRELASRGECVLVGHAGQVTLQDVPGVFKVMIGGSVERRAQRVSWDEDRTVEEALKLVRESDRERKAFFQQAYHVDLLDSNFYNLVLNSDHLSRDAAAAIVTNAFKKRTSLDSESKAFSLPRTKRACQACGGEMILSCEFHTAWPQEADDDGHWICRDCGKRIAIVLQVPRSKSSS